MEDRNTNIVDYNLFSSPRPNDKGLRQKLTLTVFAISMGVISNFAWARDDITDYSIAEALSSPEAKQQLGTDIVFYFGNQQHGEVLESYGEVGTIKRFSNLDPFRHYVTITGSTRNVKSDSDIAKDACEAAFTSALIVLKGRTLRGGGNAVINIKSIYEGEESIDEDNNNTFECGVGDTAVGVTLKGIAVKLGNK